MATAPSSSATTGHGVAVVFENARVIVGDGRVIDEKRLPGRQGPLALVFYGIGAQGSLSFPARRSFFLLISVGEPPAEGWDHGKRPDDR